MGDILLDLAAGARSQVTLIAPFMKAGVVKRITNTLAPSVELTCITRWYPHELKAGVSDIEIWDILRARGCATLLLIPTLHAKYYRADCRYAIGSANLTATALGWSVRPNLEILLSGETDAQLRDWESCLLSQATIVDESLVRHFKQLVDNLPAAEILLTDQILGVDDPLESVYLSSSPEEASWLPMLRYPELLYDAYAGRSAGMTVGAREAAMHDLLALAVPQGLDQAGFHAAVAAVLLQMPLMHELDQFLTQPRSFGSARNFLGSLRNYPRNRDPNSAWQTVMRWFRHFLPIDFKSRFLITRK